METMRSAALCSWTNVRGTKRINRIYDLETRPGAIVLTLRPELNSDIGFNPPETIIIGQVSASDEGIDWKTIEQIAKDQRKENEQ